jgi:phosphomevalonate kinase
MNHKWDYRATVKLIVLFAGKRKSGKDYVTDRLRTRLPADVSAAFVHISAPIKRKYAEMHSLDFDELMSTSSYKEAHRAAMVVWSDEQRRLDDGCFIRPALEDADPDGTRNVWVVVDTRRE